MDNLILYMSSPILGGAGAWVIGNYAPKLGFLDLPNKRSSHTRPTPKGGGVGILTAFVVSSYFLKIPISFWIPATLLSFLSFIGDKIELSTKIRLGVQFLAALILIFPLFLLKPIASPNSFLTISLIILSSIYIVGTANFYNFMDGINGISGITGIIAFGLIAFHTHISGNIGSFTILAICISLSCLGFLPFNMPRARVFIGDVGSILLGFVFAGMAIWVSKTFLDFICVAAFLFPFYVDELTTLVVRIKDGDRLTKPHRKHLYQLLANEMGIAHWKVSVGYGVLQALVGVSVISVKGYGFPIVLSMPAFCFAAFAVAGYYIRSAVAAGLRSADSTDYTN